MTTPFVFLLCGSINILRHVKYLGNVFIVGWTSSVVGTIHRNNSVKRLTLLNTFSLVNVRPDIIHEFFTIDFSFLFLRVRILRIRITGSSISTFIYCPGSEFRSNRLTLRLRETSIGLWSLGVFKNFLLSTSLVRIMDNRLDCVWGSHLL